MRRKYFSLITILILVPLLSFAQNNTFDLRYEFNKDDGTTYTNFIYARTLGKWMAEIFRVNMPVANDYHETVAGVGYNFVSLGEIAVYGLVHYNWAVDDDYFEPGVFGLDVDGKLTGSLWAAYYFPLGETGIRQILIDPVEVQYAVWGNLSVGVSSYLWQPNGGDWLVKVGPKFSYLDPYGNTELRVASVNQGGGWEFQIRRIIVF